MKYIIKILLLIYVLFISTENSSALWLGLSDGTYTVNLTPNNPGDPTASGTISISGAGISAWNIDFSHLTQNFFGNPSDIDSFPPCCESSGQGLNENGLVHELALVAEFANNVDPAPWLWALRTTNLSTRESVRIEGSWTFAAVPEPGSLILFISGILAIGFRLSRQQV